MDDKDEELGIAFARYQPNIPIAGQESSLESLDISTNELHTYDVMISSFQHDVFALSSS